MDCCSFHAVSEQHTCNSALLQAVSKLLILGYNWVFWFFFNMLWTNVDLNQWCNRQGVGQGAECLPRDFWPGNFCWPTRKKRGKEKMEKGEMEKKRREIVKRKVENWKWEEGKLQNEERTFFFFRLFTFQNHWNLFWVYEMEKWKFSSGKRHFTPGKNQEKLICPLRKIFLLRPWS